MALTEPATIPPSSVCPAPRVGGGVIAGEVEAGTTITGAATPTESVASGAGVVAGGISPV